MSDLNDIVVDDSVLNPMLNRKRLRTSDEFLSDNMDLTVQMLNWNRNFNNNHNGSHHNTNYMNHDSNTPNPNCRVERNYNHIYFYSEVNRNSILTLNKMIRQMNKDIRDLFDRYDSEIPKIYLHINSYGGSVFACFSAIDTILNSEVPVVTIVEGCAASAATLLSVVGSERFITPHSYMLIHQIRGGMWGKYSEMKDDHKNSQKLMRMIKDIYKNYTNVRMTGKTGLDRALKHDLWWNADECLDSGLVDGIWGHLDKNNKYELSDKSKKQKSKSGRGDLSKLLN